MKEQFGELWLFSSMDTKPAFMKQDGFRVSDASGAGGNRKTVDEFQDVNHTGNNYYEESKNGRQGEAATGQQSLRIDSDDDGFEII